MAPIIRTCSLLGLALACAAPGEAKREATPLGDYLRARVLETGNDPAASAAAYSRALTASPADTAIAARAYRRAIEAGDKRLALRAALALRGSPALPADAELLLLLDLIERGDWAAARLAIDRVEQRGAYDFLVPSLRAWVGFGGRDEQANSRLNLVGGLSSTYNRETLILLQLASGRIEDAVAGLRLATATDGRYAPVRLAAASRLAGLGQRQTALDLVSGNHPVYVAARKQIEDGRLTGAVVTAPNGVAFLLARLSSDLAAPSRSQTALALARIASFADRDSEFTKLTLANALSLAGQDAAALDLLASVTGPIASEAKIKRIEVLLRAGRDGEAVAEAEAGSGGGDVASLTTLAEIYARAGRHGDAARTFRTAVDAGGDAAGWQLWMNLGSALDAAGNWPAAKAALQKSLALAPDEPAILNQLGYAMLERRDDLALATQHIAKANRLQPENAAIVDSLGWAFHLRGRTGEAIPLLERAAAMRPDEPTIVEHLGDAYWTMGRKIEARYAWTAALATSEGSVEIARMRDRLRNGLPARR